jgi:hypothetical protein
MAFNPLAGFNLEPGTFKIAGIDLNPDVIKKFGWDKRQPTLSAGALNAPVPTAAPTEQNPFAGMLSKYATSYDKRRSDLLKNLGKDDQGIAAAVALSQLGQSPEQMEQQALLEFEKAKLAQEMSLKNVELLSTKAKEKQARDFTYAQVGNLLNAIPRAFAPVSSDRTQEIAANISNIMLPRNLNPQAQIQAAPYGLQTRQYFT